MVLPSKTRFVIVTGGVVSSLGKGIAGASLGNLLHARGLRVRQVKADPYWNLDPGTMAPGEHGEVYVTADGAETDLDLGHYERFTDEPCSQSSSFSFGQVASEIINRERGGDYLGKTVQIIPHVTDEIKRRILLGAEGADVAIIEIGGTVGDIESTPFMEALRQLRREIGSERMLFMHCTLVPWLTAASEFKTKPTQQSVGVMRSLGITPDVLLLRAEQPVADDLRKKIALMCDFPDEAVISCPDARDAYEVPLILNSQGLDDLVCRRLRLDDAPAPSLDSWREVCERLIGASVPVRIAIVGKYGHPDAYLSIREALRHAAAHHHRRLEPVYIDSEHVTDDSVGTLLADVDGVLIPGGFGERGIEGKVAAARYARERGLPFLGICLGMQVAVIEYARNVAGIRGAGSREFGATAARAVIDLSAEQRGVRDKGGTMRLGDQRMVIAPGTLLQSMYGQLEASERHRHRYEVSERFAPQLQEAGLIMSARHPERDLIECIELPTEQHPFYVACQAHPEFSSRPVRANPLFLGLIAASLGEPPRPGITRKAQQP